ncbi:MAG: class I SAM-dependent methyltransferase [Pyrinomonadaceae bacterium]|nr:class I SAM-dependent methyltransferase [Phycisphaerales bacterium]
MLDKYDLYELCAQAPLRDARFLRAIHGGDPRILGEDFSGGGAIARQWVEIVPEGKAVAVDLDPEPLQRLRGHKGITVVCADVNKATQKADIIADLNFSICEIHKRVNLVAYFKHALSRLKRGGVFVADIYGGSDSYYTGTISQRKNAPGGERITYDWEQRHADPLTGRVVNAMHFRVSAPPAKAGKKKSGVKSRPVRLDDAFVYHWRLWTVAELREALTEAGFKTTQVFPRFAEAIDDDGNLYVSPVSSPSELGDSYSVYVVGRK